MDPPHGQVSQAGEAMHNELDAIQERLRELKRELDARQSLADVADEMAQRVTTNRAAVDD